MAYCARSGQCKDEEAQHAHKQHFGSSHEAGDCAARDIANDDT